MKAPKLTPGQARIICLVAEGLSPQEIANISFVSLRTVDRQFWKMKQKFGTSNRILWLKYYGYWQPKSGEISQLKTSSLKWEKRPVPPCALCGREKPTKLVITGISAMIRMCSDCEARLEEQRLSADARLMMYTEDVDFETAKQLVLEVRERQLIKKMQSGNKV